MSAMDAEIGETLYFEGKAHVLEDRVFRGFVPPYFVVRCVDHPRCVASLVPITHWCFKRDETRPTVTIVLRGQPTASEER